MKTNETATVKMVIDLSDYQNVDNVVIVLKKSQEEQIKRVQPKTKDELKTLIDETIKEQGYACDLNFIDTSLINDMSCLFYDSIFNGDISTWDVSNVNDMGFMFACSKFNGDISTWDVSKVTDMRFMFSHSEFNGNISSWNVSKVTDMSYMFYNSPFNGNISYWNYMNDVKRRDMFKK
jgi:surface protein